MIHRNNFEILIEDDICNKEFYIYIINHNNKTWETYIMSTIPRTIDFIINYIEKNNTGINIIGTYLERHMYYTFKNLSKWCNERIYHRSDIFSWRMCLPPSVRKVTGARYITTRLKDIVQSKERS